MKHPTVKAMKLACICSSLWLGSGLFSLAQAGGADVVDGAATALGDGKFRIDATVAHADTGWDHYADSWEVLGPDGAVLGVRELAHPHVNEQPFTRSLTLEIPDGVTTVTLRATDSVHGLGGESFILELPQK